MKIKNFTIFFLGSITVLLLSACATHENFIIKHNAWVGEDISKFISSVGHPDKTYTLPNKNIVYVYAESRIESFPMMMGGGGMWGGGMMMGPGMWGPWGGGMMMGNHIEQRTCKLFLEVNKYHKIVRWSSRGNDCVSSSPY